MTKRDRAVEIAGKISDALGIEDFDRMTKDAIDDVIADLRKLRPLLGGNFEAGIAIEHLENMKRPRADKRAYGQLAKDVAYGLKIVADNLAE
jgi:hypothetical protein